MKRLTAFFIFWLGSMLVAQASLLSERDSVGTETVNGKVFILYRVEPKETLYGISTKYQLSVAELVKHNPETETGLKVGSILRIPYTRPQQSTASASGKFHTVEAKETLYSISRQYGISIEELKSWNNLSGNTLSPGDRLRVSKPGAGVTASTTSPKGAGTTPPAGATPQQPRPDYSGKIVHTVEEQETLFSIARMYDSNVAKLRELNNLTTDNLAIGQKLIVGTAKGLPAPKTDRIVRTGAEEEKAKDHGYNANPVAISQIGEQSQEELETASTERVSVRKVTEMGMATSIDDSLNTKKYLALHRTAPIGTIMQVHNEMNNLSVFVRVVGKLPPTGDNDKVLIKLSRKAYEKLGAYSEKVPVRLSYVP
ncbi:LysM peptidoglycan-binding domain-containing protein [Cesiribacter andamanensis]|nr:LysM peptidoglycan-binding domain-containing protein [Cesiribacter andamanensis]